MFAKAHDMDNSFFIPLLIELLCDFPKHDLCTLYTQQ